MNVRQASQFAARIALAALLSLVMIVPAAVGQEQDNGEAGAAADDANKTPPPLREQTIYVPYSKLRDSFEKKGRGVFVPYDEFQRLWRAARDAEPQAREDRPPVGALITEVENEATIQKDVVSVAAKLKIELLAEGWHEVRLRLADAAISSAKLGDRLARVVPDPQGGYKLLVKRDGKEPQQIELDLQYSKAYTKAPGQNSVSLEAPQAPVNRWRIRIPEAGVRVNVHPMIAAAEVPAAEQPAADGEGKETVVLAFVGAAPTVRIEWNPKAEGAAGLAALATVQAHQQVTVDEGVIRTRTQLVYDISRADLSQLRVEVPADHKVSGVFDPNVRGWEVEPNEDKQTVTIQLFEPTRGTQQVTVELEKFSGEFTQKQIEVPEVKALDVGRQQGVVVVRLGEGLRGESVSRSGLLQMDAADLPQAMRGGNWSFAYRYATLPFDLKLDVEKIQPRILAEQLVEAYLEPEQITLDLLVIYDVQRAGVFQLDLNIPEGYEIGQVRGRQAAGAQEAVVDTYHVADDDKSQLQINLARKAMGKVGLFVELSRRLDDPNLISPTGETSDIPLPLPRVAPASVERATGQLIVYKPESLRVNPGQQDGLRAISFAEAYQQMPSCRDSRFPLARAALAFAYTGEDVTLTLRAERRKPHVTARQLLVTHIESGQVRYEARFRYSIRYSGVKSLRVDVPAALAAEIRNDTPAVREEIVEPAPEDLADGYVAWNLTGESEFIGDVAVRLSWEQKIDDLDIGKSVTLTVPVLRPMGVDRAWGQIVVAKSETIDVSTEKEEGLRPIDPQIDLLPDDRTADGARAYEFHEDWSLALTATRYKLEEIKHTSIELGVVRQVVTRSNQISVQALYRMRSAQQRLAIKLPDNVRFDSQPLRINDQPVPLESGDAGLMYVPLVGRNRDEAFLLELRYTLDGTAGHLTLPEFPSEPAVQKIYVCAYVPEEYALLGSRGPWTDERLPWWQRRSYGQAPGSDVNLIQQVTRDVNVGTDPAESFQTAGALYVFSTLRPAPGDDGALSLLTMNENYFQVLVFAIVAVLGLALLNRPLRHKFTALALLVIGLILVGVFMPTLSEQVFDSVLFWAVAIVLIVWVVWFVVHDLPRRLPTPAWATASGAPPSPPPMQTQSKAPGAAEPEARSEPQAETPAAPPPPPKQREPGQAKESEQNKATDSATDQPKDEDTGPAGDDKQQGGPSDA